MTYTTASRVHAATALALSEDWAQSVAIGFLVTALALASLRGIDLLGSAATTKVWPDPTRSLAPFAKDSDLDGFVTPLQLSWLCWWC